MPDILIVDDRGINRQFLSTLLGYAGYRTAEAADGAEALEKVRSALPDLVITDILMPVMDGEEFVRRMRQEPALAAVPVVFYSATFLAQDIQRIARECGVEAVLSKPAEPELILATVARLLGGKALPAPLPGPGGPTRLADLRSLHDGGGGAPAVEGRGPGGRIDRAGSFAGAPSSGAAAGSLPLRLAALVELGLAAAETRDLDALVDLFAGAARDIRGGRFTGVGLLDDAGAGLARCAARGGPAGMASPPARAGVPGEVLESGRLRLVEAEGRSPAVLGLPAGHPPVRSLLVVPVVSKSVVYGWLYLADPVAGGGFDGVDEQLATILASQIAVASEAARLSLEIQAHAALLREEVAVRKAAEERYRSLFEEAAEGILRTSVEKRVLDANPAMVRILGYDDERQFREAITDFEAQVVFDPADVEPFHRAIATDGKVVNFESRFRRRDGKPVWVRVHIRAVRDAGGAMRALEGMVTDISNEKILQDQLHHSMRLEAIGRLSGGVAHDFNNLLTVILGQCSLMLPRVAGDGSLRKGIEDIQGAGWRAAALTRQLLAFSRKQVLRHGLLDANEVVRNLERILRLIIGEDVVLETALAESPWPVMADSGEVEQVLLNMAVNARDAMPRGGRLRMETRNVRMAGPTPVCGAPLPPGEFLRITVSDTGTGMAPELIERIFEPFFTTKETGTGLGLATAGGIIRASGGGVAVESEPGRGTTFTVYLPRAGHAGALPAGEVEECAPPRGAETVLLAEDEEIVRKLTQILLEAQGYRVIEASSGPAALDRLAREKEPVHLLLTDTVMPGMGGRELAGRALAARPGLKVLFMSGYTDDDVVRHGVVAREVAFLQKPFTPLQLARAVREALDGKGRARQPGVDLPDRDAARA